jgi:hypothetical protein
MGYPMSYQRVVGRNYLIGDYAAIPLLAEAPVKRDQLAGDLRRLEADSRDETHLIAYAEHAGITPAQAKAVLDMFFGDAASRERGPLEAAAVDRRGFLQHVSQEVSSAVAMARRARQELSGEPIHWTPNPLQSVTAAEKYLDRAREAVDRLIEAHDRPVVA